MSEAEAPRDPEEQVASQASATTPKVGDQLDLFIPHALQSLIELER